MQKNNSLQSHKINITVADSLIGLRLDQALSQTYSHFSRNRIQQAIKNGDILVNKEEKKAKSRLNPGDLVAGFIHEEVAVIDEPEDIPLDIIHQDEDIILINKPADLVVHPAPGNLRGTLLNALLYHFPKTRQLPRAGIIHRLDKDTSGIMVVAHSLTAYHHLVNQLQERTMGRSYSALAYGYITAGDTIDKPIGRDRKDRKKMSIRSDGKSAITHYRIKERFENFTLLDVHLETGRTHQIRVHLTSINHPLVGDQTYKNGRSTPKNTSDAVKMLTQNFKRQALHAHTLRLQHPTTQEQLSFSAPLPSDFEDLLTELRRII